MGSLKVLPAKGETCLVYCENAPTVGALQACFGNIIGPNHTATLPAEVREREVVFGVHDLGILFGFTPFEDWESVGGFPYLLTRVSPAFYHVILLPVDRSLTDLSTIAASQAYLNDLPNCLVLHHDSCCYVNPQGTVTHSKEIPHGGIDVTGVSCTSRNESR